MNYKVKGTYDLLPEEAIKWEYVTNKLKEIFKKYNYKEISYPNYGIFRSFSPWRWIFGYGPKETYNFVDKGNRNITCVQATAGIMNQSLKIRVMPKMIF